MNNGEMATVYSKQYNEEICYYIDDLNYSYTVFGCGYRSGRGYEITFDEENNVVEIWLIF